MCSTSPLPLEVLNVGVFQMNAKIHSENYRKIEKLNFSLKANHIYEKNYVGTCCLFLFDKNDGGCETELPFL